MASEAVRRPYSLEIGFIFKWKLISVPVSNGYNSHSLVGYGCHFAQEQSCDHGRRFIQRANTYLSRQSNNKLGCSDHLSSHTTSHDYYALLHTGASILASLMSQSILWMYTYKFFCSFTQTKCVASVQMTNAHIHTWDYTLTGEVREEN